MRPVLWEYHTKHWTHSVSGFFVYFLGFSYLVIYLSSLL